MRNNQEFIWGQDLKLDLSKLNKHYLALPNFERDKGLSSFSGRPPTQGDFLTTKLWDKIFPSWRTKKSNTAPLPQKTDDKLLKELKSFTEAPTLNPELVDFSVDEADGISLQRSISKKKGSWYQLPKDLKE